MPWRTYRRLRVSQQPLPFSSILRHSRFSARGSIPCQATITDMDDPALRLLAKCKLIRPRGRCKGEYAPESIEPARTVRFVRRALTMGGVFPCMPRFCGGPSSKHQEQQHVPPSPAEEAAYRYEELSLWLAPGSGGSLRGALYGIVVMVLQLFIALAIAVYSVLGDLHPWAKRTALSLMCTAQLLMAGWAVLGDPIDRLAGLIASIVSLLECVATVLLLAASVASEDPTLDPSAMSSASTTLLMISVFVPIGLSAYDAILLPTVEMFKAKMGAGGSCGGALLSVLTAALLLPVTIIMAVGGINFKGADALMAVAEEEDVGVGAGLRELTRAKRLTPSAKGRVDKPTRV